MTYPTSLLISLIIITSPLHINTQQFPPIEETVVEAGDLGRIEGRYSLLSRPLDGDRDYYYYYTGIPYADPKSYTRDNRFKPSELYTGPLTEDGSTFIADKPFIWCPQEKLLDINLEISEFNFTDLLRASRDNNRGLFPGGDDYMGQEDCLILTVSTPKIQQAGQPELDPTELLPVIVFYHGGGFNQFWGSVFGGHRLLNRDVVFVSLNYRLGILGSLNLGLDGAPGSQLVYDALTALKWVKAYIHHFGGDPNRITVSGQSAGAVVSTAVFLSPLSQNLISGAIGDSGSAYSIWATNLSPLDDHLQYARFTSCRDIVDAAPSEDRVDFPALMDCIKGLELGELVKSQREYSTAENRIGKMGYDALIPSVQSPSLTIERCIVESPKEVLRNKRQANVPLMMGVTRHDGSFVFDTTYNEYLLANGYHYNLTFIKNDFLPTFLRGLGLVDTTGALIHGLMKTYVGDAAKSNDFNDLIPGILDIHTVLGFKSGAYGLVEEHAKLNPNSYYYAFDYKGMWSTYPFANGGSPVPGGIAHVDDLIYLFQLFPLFSEEDIQVCTRYVDYWYNFAAFGNPNGPGDPDDPFPRYDSSDHKFLVINTTDTVGRWCRDTWVDNGLELM